MNEKKDNNIIKRSVNTAIFNITPNLDKFSFTPYVILAGFAFFIAVGTILLVLPAATAGHESASFVDALFTATSAVCVTGLVVQETGAYWSLFGQIVILFLMQIGGFGIMSGVTLILLGFNGKLTLSQRLLAKRSLGEYDQGGIASVIKKMALMFLACEAAGALIFFAVLLQSNGAGTALWRSVFHAVSAFNNAGFDIFTGSVSLEQFSGNPIFLLTTSVLIIMGGISFMVLKDIVQKRELSKLSLDTKLVLVVTAVLLLGGWMITFFCEIGNPSIMPDAGLGEKLLNSFFHSVTSRTAGFSTISPGNLASSTLFITILLMFVGGATGSAAGGVKVNTLGMVLASIWSTLRRRPASTAFGREFSQVQVGRAYTIIFLSLGLIVAATYLLCITEQQPFLPLVFETVSAFGTVGLSTGITPSLSLAGKMIITITMFAGRLGPFVLAVSFIQRKQPVRYRYPQENVRIG